MRSFLLMMTCILGTASNAYSSSDFEILSLPSTLKTQMTEMGTWKTGCPVDIDRLRLVKFIHYDFSGEQKQGELVVLEAIATRVVNIFKTLHGYQFPIAQAKTMEHYNGLDKPSMAANNSSAFLYRSIAGKTLISVHSYGVAIDVNPIQNPCIEPQTIVDEEEVRLPVQPAAGQEYLNRTNVRPGMVEQCLDATNGLRVVDLFKQNGFHVWGGNWNDPVDWQHFQPSRAAAEWLAFMSPEDATLLYEFYIENPKLLNNAEVRKFDFKAIYEENPSYYMQTLQNAKFFEMLPEDAYNSLKH